MIPSPRTARGHIGLLACFLLGLAGSARAERRRVTLGVQPIYALAFVDRRDPSGGGVGVDLAFYVTDALSLRASGFVTFHAADGLTTGAPGAERVGPDGSIASFGAFAGVHYALDVVRIVPSFDLGIGVLGLRGSARFGSGPDAAALLPAVNAFAVELGFATDYLITRRWSVGFVVRYHALLTALDEAPSFLYLGPRATLSLGY